MKKSSSLIQLSAILLGLAFLSGCNQSPAAPPVTEPPVTFSSPTGTPSAPPGSTRRAATEVTRSVPTIITLVANASRTPFETASPAPTFTPKATLPFSANLSPTGLKYLLIERFGNIFFCDPDLYPVAHEVSEQEIAQRITAMQQNPEEYHTILEHLGLLGFANLSPAQKRLIDADHKRLDAIQLEPSAQGSLFRLRTREQAERGFAIEGTISSEGTITVSKREETVTSCPICLSGSALIDTPQGAVPVKNLHRGMPVWTATRTGKRERAIILETVRRPVPRGVTLVHLVLDDGRELFVSAAHPTLNGQRVGDLFPGDLLDGAHVTRVDRVRFEDDATYDLLPSGETGAYWANDILLGSTLAVTPTVTIR